MSSLTKIDLPVPPSPDLEREGHASFSAHVSESTLSRARGSRSADSGNSGSGTSGSPGLGRMPHSGHGVDSSGLAGVLGEVVVNELDNIVSNGRREHLGSPDFSEHFRRVFVVEDTDCGSHEIYKPAVCLCWLCL